MSTAPSESRRARTAPINASRQLSGTLDTDTVESPRGSPPKFFKGSNIMLTPESPIANAFKSFPDFAKVNSDSHNAQKADTFNTPQALPAGFHTASRLISRKGFVDQGEFQHRMLKAVHDMQVAQQEQQEAMEKLRQEMTNSLNEQTSARGMLERISELAGVLEEKSRQPLDLSSVLEELQSARSTASERQDRMEGRITQQMKQMMEEIHTVREQQDQAEKGHLVEIHEGIFNVKLAGVEVKDIVHRSEIQLSDVLKLTQSVSADSVRTSRDVQEIQDHHAKMIQNVDTLLMESKQHYSDFVPCLQAQLTTYLRQNPVNVNFEEVLTVLSRSRSSMQIGFDQLLNEIARVQQALNVDFARVIDDLADNMRKTLHDKEIEQKSEQAVEATQHSVALATPVQMQGNRVRTTMLAGTAPLSRSRRRFRNYWSQTDILPTAEAWVQTDDEIWKSAMKPKKNKGRKEVQPDEPAKKKKPHHNRSTAGRKAFQDAEAMKNQVRNQLCQPQYNVMDYYWETGCIQRIARHPIFENFTLLVVLVNVIWIGVDTDHNDASMLIDAHPVFQVAENFFCAYFTFELLIRFLAFKDKKRCLRDFWFVFDSILVIVMIAETWILSIVLLSIEQRPSGDFGGLSILRVFRFARVVRVSRLAKLLRAIPEIVILLKGILIAMRSVVVFFILWLVIIFIFAIIFVQFTNDEDGGKRYFRSVPVAMNTLLLNGLLPENESLVNEVTNLHPLFWVLIMAFIVLASLTLMHMLVGVLVETIRIISAVEKESMAVLSVSEQLRFRLEVLDYDPQGTLSKREFQNFIMDPGVARLFQAEGVDTNVLIDMAEIIFQDLETKGSSGLTFEMLVDIVLNMRGSNPATVKDVKEQLRLIKSIMRESLSHMHSNIVHDLELLKAELTAVVEAHSHAADAHSESDDAADDVSEDMTLQSHSQFNTEDMLTVGLGLNKQQVKMATA